MTSGNLSKCISSQASADGRSRCECPACLMTRQSGRDLRRASLLASQGNKSDSKTNDTSPQSCSISSQSADLQLSLVNRLRQQFRNTGSILYSLTWKQKVTPAHRPYYQLAASVLRINASDYFFAPWVTTSVRDGKGGYLGGRIRHGKWCTDALDVTSQLAGWSTPQVHDKTSARAPRLKGNHRDPMKIGSYRSDLCDARFHIYAAPPTWELTPCPTPTANNGTGAGSSGRQGGLNLQTAMSMAKVDSGSQALRITARGDVLTGLDAGMDISGQLNPEHSRWLMGYPSVWGCLGVTAMQSYRKSRKSSYAPLWWE